MIRGFGNETGALRTTPWARRERDGLYIGHDKTVWLFRELPLAPLQHEDPARRTEVGQVLEDVLEEIGARSRDIGQGLSLLSQNREVQIFAVTYNTVNRPPDGTPEALAGLLDDLLDPVVTSKALLLGVKLRSAAFTQAVSASGDWKQKFRALIGAQTEDTDLSLAAYHDDLADMDALIRRHHGMTPRLEALAQLEAWWNHGHTPDQVVHYDVDSFSLPGGRTYQLRSVMEFPKHMQAPFAQWLLDAMSHPSPAVAVSIRAELEPPTVTRTRLRHQRRKLLSQQEEEEATGDLGREENTHTLQYAQDIESYVIATRQPWLTGASFLLAHQVDGADDTFAEHLASVYGIVTQPVRHRQREALDEFQPASATRINPFKHDVNLALVAYAGLASFSNLGDGSGMFLGHIDPDDVPCYLDPFTAAKQNLPPVMGVFGDPGSGKTFAAQLLAGQAALAGLNVIFVNPKGYDTLSPWVDWVRSQGVPARTVSLSKIEKQGGAFDPFSFCADPKMAAEILARHIHTVLGDALTPRQEFTLAEGLTNGAEAGARCAMDALGYVEDTEIVDLVRSAVRSYTLFALAFSSKPRDDWQGTSGLTLIEFDRELPMPTPGQRTVELAERLALATLRLTSRAAMEILMRESGGMYVIDEAHHYISSSEGMASLERLAREGRSVGLLPVFITQRPSDLLSIDMESFMSRVLCMKLNDAREATAALQLCRLEPTASRVAFLRDAGPRRGSEGVPGRPAMGILRDPYDRHAVVSIGPVPEHLRLAMSTNRTDRELRDGQVASPASDQSTEVS